MLNIILCQMDLLCLTMGLRYNFYAPSVDSSSLVSLQYIYIKYAYFVVWVL